MNFSEFYERYWLGSTEHGDQGQLVNQRKVMLQSALSDLTKGARVLDAGCGSGFFTAFLGQLGFDAVGIDLSSTALQHAHQRYPGVRFELGAIGESLPFQTREFQAVWCSEVLEHLFDVSGALEEFNRVLTGGGKLVITTPYHGLSKNLISATVFFDRHFDPCGPHIRFFSRRALTRCLNHAGFEVEQWRGIGRFWPVWMSHFVLARKLPELRLNEPS